MNSKDLVQKLSLLPHPEGGYYREIYRSGAKDGKRAAMTSIYFLLERGQVSRWHVVDADEAWHFYEGGPLELLVMPPDFSRVERYLLGEVSAGNEPVFVVPAGWWQAARPVKDYALAGCTVAPGFEFAGFRFLEEEEKRIVAKTFPEHPELL
jgi:uncharacterized protein